MLNCEGPETLIHEFLSAALNEIELSSLHYEIFDAGQGPSADFALEAVLANKQSRQR